MQVTDKGNAAIWGLRFMQIADLLRGDRCRDSTSSEGRMLAVLVTIFPTPLDSLIPC